MIMITLTKLLGLFYLFVVGREDLTEMIMITITKL